MTVLLTLVTAGVDSGPFDLYSNLDSFTVPFEVGVSRVDLMAGYLSVVVPDYTSTIRIQSTGICINSIDVPVVITGYEFSLARGTSVIDACLNANAL